MAPYTTLAAGLLFWIFFHQGSLRTTLGNTDSDIDDPVSLAISKLRERLRSNPSADVPYAFPQTKYRLAILLESKLSTSATAVAPEEAVEEIASLLESSAMNATHGFAPSIRVQTLTRAATLLLEADEHSVATLDQTTIKNDGGPPARQNRAEEMLRHALNIRTTNTGDNDGTNIAEEDKLALESAHAVAFEMLVQIYLAKASKASTMGNLKKEVDLLEAALDLCKICLELSPNEPVVHEYHGATIRRLHGKRSKSNSPDDINSSMIDREVHDAYKNAADKSHQAAIRATLTPEALAINSQTLPAYGETPPSDRFLNFTTDNVEDEILAFLTQLWTRLVRHIVLATAAAREASLRDDEDRHIAYGLEILSHEILSSFVTLEQQVELLTNAGICHKKRGEKQEAAVFFRRVLDISPQDGHAMVQLASLGDTDAASVTTLSNSYVADLFDGYSERFEEELVKTLHYRGHELVADAISRHWNSKAEERGLATKTADADDKDNTLLVLDLGCGTGLLGALLRERLDDRYNFRGSTHEYLEEHDIQNANDADETCHSSTSTNVTIHGVDLSPRMVEISKGRSLKGKLNYIQQDSLLDDEEDPSAFVSVPVYDNVRVTDATTFLKSFSPGTTSIIVASDVFIYIGALHELFVECARVLRGGGQGLLSFTVEVLPSDTTSTSDDGEGLRLLTSGRFGHSRKYIENITHKVGLELTEWKDEVLRKQGNQDVAGAVVTLRKQ